MTSEVRARLHKSLIKYATVLAVGVTYLAFVLLTGVGLPCPFYKITGWQCPGCGISRMLISLIRLDLVSAYNYNPFLLTTAPILLFCLIYSEFRYVKYGNASLGKLQMLLWAELFSAIAFGIFRNIF